MIALRPDQRALILQFLRFGVVGGLGTVVNIAVVYAAKGPLGLYGAGAVAYPVAATFNWLVNRVWTFRETRGNRGMRSQWVRFMAVNLIGFALNYGTYSVLIYASPLCRDVPMLAVVAGVIVGMFANFGLSRRLVFS
jgi:putative flippase GtrA